MKSIGAITFYWATFEFEIMDVIGTALGLGLKERRMLMGKSNPKMKAALLKTIASHYAKDKSLQKELKELARITTQLFEMRNRFAHGVWVHPKADSSVYQLLVLDTGEDAYLPRRMSATAQELADLEDWFRGAMDKANATIGMLRVAMKSSPQAR